MDCYVVYPHHEAIRWQLCPSVWVGHEQAARGKIASVVGTRTKLLLVAEEGADYLGSPFRMVLAGGKSLKISLMMAREYSSLLSR